MVYTHHTHARIHTRTLTKNVTNNKNYYKTI